MSCRCKLESAAGQVVCGHSAPHWYCDTRFQSLKIPRNMKLLLKGSAILGNNSRNRSSSHFENSHVTFLRTLTTKTEILLASGHNGILSVQVAPSLQKTLRRLLSFWFSCTRKERQLRPAKGCSGTKKPCYWQSKSSI